jgi:hypothetical protein
MRIIKYSLFLVIIVSLQACFDTYYMSADNLHKELNKVQDTAYAYNHKFWDAIVFTKYFNNGLKQITCYDEKGKPYMVDIYNETVAIITLNNGDVDRFIFHTMFAKDSLVYGQLSFPSTQIKIKLKDIKSIRIKSPQQPHSY